MGVFEILRSSKNVFIHIRGSLKFMFLLIIAAVLIAGLVSLVYKPAYAVNLNGEFIGYTANKSKLQNKISEYMKTGDGENIAFVDIELLPEYSFCFLKREVATGDEEILANVKDVGTVYYAYYAVVVDGEEKSYVRSKSEAEDIINQLKEKKSDNVSKIAYTKIHDTELKEFADTASIVIALYVAPPPVVTVASLGGSTKVASVSSKPTLGIDLVSPTSGVISSRFGRRSGETHTGLDIAGSYGTSIRAVASGTVTYAANSGSGYGQYVKISHGKGIETLYAHCSSLLVSTGQYVEQGEKIALMGSTGRSTGNHLHLEIRVNGVAVNPQNYLY